MFSEQTASTDHPGREPAGRKDQDPHVLCRDSPSEAPGPRTRGRQRPEPACSPSRRPPPTTPAENPQEGPGPACSPQRQPQRGNRAENLREAAAGTRMLSAMEPPAPLHAREPAGRRPSDPQVLLPGRPLSPTSAENPQSTCSHSSRGRSAKQWRQGTTTCERWRAVSSKGCARKGARTTELRIEGPRLCERTCDGAMIWVRMRNN